MSKTPIKFKVECEIPRIRTAYVECPVCNVEFDVLDYGKTEEYSKIIDCVDLQFARIKCPSCGYSFSTRGKQISINDKIELEY
jgi:predicted nucleic-acid-binding Zn-ribbon protein